MSLSPNLQISFAQRLETIRSIFLQPARERTVSLLPDVAALDQELAQYVGTRRLRQLAASGLRGEIFYPVPLILKANPQMLGYYRLLLGFSQKEFYDKANTPAKGFRSMEEKGVIPKLKEADVVPLCESLIESAELLIDGLGQLTIALAHDLQLLTIGPQLRGSRNNDLGKQAVGLVFNLIRSLIGDEYVEESGENAIRLLNSAGRHVVLRFSADPDIAVMETVGKSVKNRVAIEVKGGTDASNRLNRLGEAEKSHLKAKQKGFTEFWTITAVRADVEDKDNSPTTTSFFALGEISRPDTEQAARFAEAIGIALGIPVIKN